MANGAIRELGEDFRLRALIAVEGFLRLTREAVARYGDLETLMVYLTVITAGGGRALRDPEILESDGGPLPQGYYRPVSRRAVALATGLPRETVRRKVAWLVAEGWLAKEGRSGVRGTYDVLSQRENLAFARAAIADFEATAERLRRPRPDRGGRDPADGA